MREDRWQNLLRASFRLEEQLDPAPSAGEVDRYVRALLDNLLEVFPADIDPVEDFEGFALRRFAQALAQAFAAQRRQAG